MASITIDGKTLKVKNGTTILKAAEQNGIKIPTLCFLEEINEIGFCRVCVVEVEDEQDLVSSCNTEVANGMVIYTNSEKVKESRKATLDLLASKHRFDCWKCPKDGMCEFYDMLKEHDIVFEEFGPGIGRTQESIYGTGISQDLTKCILCKRCVAVCQEVVTANVLKFRDEDPLNPVVSPTPGLTFDESGCIFCGQCVKACPTGTLFETNHVQEVEDLLLEDHYVIAQIAEEARVGLREEFGHDMEDAAFDDVFDQAMKMIGFEETISTGVAEDLHVSALGEELLAHIQAKKDTPLLSSWCSSFVRYSELYYNDYLDQLSTLRSPHILQGSLLKHYEHKAKDNVKVISIMPCTSKKYEITREELKINGDQAVDYVLTVREIAKMIKRRGFDLDNIKPAEKVDSPYHEVRKSSYDLLENVLAYVSHKMNVSYEQPKYKVIYGERLVETEGFIEEATVKFGKEKFHVLRVSGGQAVKQMYKLLKDSKKKYLFADVSQCSSGCKNGGGQPIYHNVQTHSIIQAREEAIALMHQNKQTTTNEYAETLLEGFFAEQKELLETSFSVKEFTKE
jgi:NADP-reducing hydrogenase subunit HndD